MKGVRLLYSFSFDGVDLKKMKRVVTFVGVPMGGKVGSETSQQSNKSTTPNSSLSIFS